MVNNKKLNVLLLFGGKSAEHEISVLSARSVYAALDKQRFNVVLAGISRSGLWVMGAEAEAAMEAGVVGEPKEGGVHICPGGKGSGAFIRRSGGQAGEEPLPVDVVLPILHGTFGEDGTIQGLLEMLEIPYAGCGVAASAAGMDKSAMKNIWKSCGLPVLPGVTILRSSFEKDPASCCREIASEIGFPCFVKPANAGSSVGISKAGNEKELEEALRLAARFDRKILAEKACRNPMEIEISVIGNDEPECSVPGRISYSSKFYDYETKYNNVGDSRLTIPADIDPAVSARVEELAKKAWTAADLNGLARIDFLLSDEGELWLNEVNTMPGFTSISMFPKMWEASGLKYSDLLTRVIELALERSEDLKRNQFKP